MNKKVLIIGGGGFLGVYLTEKLIQKGYIVTVADINNKTHCKANFIYCDIQNSESIDSLFKSEFHVVYNFAAISKIENANINPELTFKINFLPNIRIIENCIKHNSLFVFASSSYAMTNKGSFYGISKLATEKIIEEYGESNKLKYIILRYGSVYADKNYENNYIYNLLKSVIESNKIIHHGDGQEYREYIHAMDASELAINVIESDEHLNNIYLLTGNNGIKRADLFKMISEILDKKIDVKLDSSTKTNHYKFSPYNFNPSLSLKLTPRPEIDLGQGIVECLKDIYSNGK